MATPPRRKNAKRDFDNVVQSPDFDQKLKKTQDDLAALVTSSYESFTSEMTLLLSKMTKDSGINFAAIKESMIDEIKKLAISISRLEDENAKNSNAIRSLSSVQNNLSSRLNQLEQEKLNSSIEITGLCPAAMHPDKPAKEIAKQVLAIYNVSKFKHAYKRQVNTKSGTKNLLVVTFSSYEEKMIVLNKKRTTDMGRKCTVYFNHCLTSFNRSLYMSARIASKSSNLKVAISRGRIFIRRAIEKFGTPIKSQNDLDDIVKSKS